ncbi:DUF1559 domain-containing protein [Ruficoccus sp. ZRK36]|uniref:DUF1559 family PulG-like putative transporter n=1 Tax=Ruficoccus sp. ZRK36 TaxID=2866311 RepID=UPI001C72F92E|nr:DUF1559 domain-containing protein [Ruficoccus sp. ZRK36]QYY34387.1 DUF1559 domain-containing protein [Ruficoccus sp. ZRK36]
MPQLNSSHTTRFRWSDNVRPAFSLVELMVVMVVLAVLAAVLVPMASTIMRDSNQTKCVQNLRSIGVAMHLYASDHGGKLPGPTYNSQKAGPDDRRFLAYYLLPYIGHPNEGAGSSYPESAPIRLLWTTPVLEFRCPSTEDDEISYVAAHSIRSDTNTNMSPWGLVSGSYGRNMEPMTLLQLDSHYALAGQWAIRDRYGVAPAYRPSTNQPVGPPRHGLTNVLFFDGHVEGEK